MTPERWQQVEAVLEAALDRAADERAAFLDETCAGDPSLRSEVESFLAMSDLSDRLMETPAASVEALLLNDPNDTMDGRRIGSYQILREVGRGGMGAVYLAARADDQFCKQVAIKLVKRGMDSDSILRRFRNERQILADLDHPNITKLLDGGTTEDGLSYFIMDYVEGQPIDVYCDTHKLSITERLGLFRTVCSAVQYAHERHIVHRDLKPSNILVTAEGVPKLLDFGIAKALHPERSSQTLGATATALRPMTPEYASPEQVRGGPVTPASDIYSLGVLLYQLLTGHRPYHVQAHTPQEVERIVCEKEPEKPSTAIGRVEEMPSTDGVAQITLAPESVSATRADSPEKLRRRLTGDLDTIVLMALRKEPARRYASVAAFSEDVARHLEGRPVVARKDSLAYRGGKFLTRNKAGVVAAAVIAVVLVLVVGVELYRLPQRNQAIEKGLERSMLPKAIGSVAVLPLENLSHDPEQEYFADGMTEALITNLAQVRALRVIARTSVMRYKDARTPPREVAQHLGVEALIEGSVQHAGYRVKITAKLIHAATEQTLWAKSYERDLRDILVLQNEVAQAITQEIRIGLSPQEQKRMASARPVDYAAYEAYLKARAHFWNTFAQREMEKSIGYYRLAIEKDPNYALAYASMAECYALLGGYGLLAPDQSFPLAQEAAQRALSLDETLAEAHHAMAGVKLFYRWDLTGAEHEFRRAIELNPGYALVHSMYANLLSIQRQRDAALAERERAVELDPLSPVINALLVVTFSSLGQYDQAIQQGEKAVSMDPNSWLAHRGLGRVYLRKGRQAEAIREHKKALSLSRGTAAAMDLAYTYAVAGRRTEAEQILQDLKARSRHDYVSPFSLAMIYAGLGEKELAFESLYKAYEERSPGLPWLAVEHAFASLRSDPRYADLVRRVGLSP